MAMEKNPNTNPSFTVAQTVVGDPKGPRPPGFPQAPLPAGGAVNPLLIIRRALAHWPVAAAVMVVGVLITAQVVRMRQPLYKSETVIFYRPGVINAEGGNTADNLRTLGTKLKELLLAQSNLKKVIDESHLYADIVDKRGYSDAVIQFRKQIEFKARSNDTFAISFVGSSRDEAQEVTARLADMIVEENSRSHQERAKGQTDFLEGEKKLVDELLDRLEKDLAQFTADHPEFATDSGGRAGAAVRAEQKKVGIALAGDRQAARQRGGAVGGGKPVAGGGAFSGPPVDPLLITGRTQAMNELIAAKKDLADKSLRYTEQHPDVRSATQRIAAAEAALQKAEEAIVAAQQSVPSAPVSVEDPYADTSKRVPPRVAGGAPAAVPKPKEPEKTTDATLVTLETEWVRLNREVGRLRTQQGQLETKLFNAGMIASSEVGGYAATIAILDPAFKPAGPSGTPNRTILAAGFIASLLAGIALAAARGIFLDDRLFDASEIEGFGLVPVLGVVPKQKVEKKTKTRGIRA
jgi:hypothetical protein